MHGTCTGDVEIIERIAGRVVLGNVQCLEIMPLVLNLRTVDHCKPKSPHQLPKFGHHLSNRVQTPQSRTVTRKCHVKIRNRPHRLRRQLLLTQFKLLGYNCSHLVETLTHRRLFRWCCRAHQLLQVADSAVLLAQKLNPHLLDRRGITRCRDRSQRSSFKFTKRSQYVHGLLELCFGNAGTGTLFPECNRI